MDCTTCWQIKNRYSFTCICTRIELFHILVLELGCHCYKHLINWSELQSWLCFTWYILKKRWFIVIYFDDNKQSCFLSVSPWTFVSFNGALYSIFFTLKKEIHVSSWRHIYMFSFLRFYSLNNYIDLSVRKWKAIFIDDFFYLW